MAIVPGRPNLEGLNPVAYDNQSNAVAAVTVCSAGSGNPGLIEPTG